MELPLEYSPVHKVQLPPSIHFATFHFPFVPCPGSTSCDIGRGIEHSPAVGFVVSPLPVILEFSIGEEELPLSVHDIIFPASLVVAAIFEYVFAFAVFEVVFLLADVLVAIGVLLVHLHKFLLLFDHLLDPSAKLPVGHGKGHHGSLRHLAVSFG